MSEQDPIQQERWARLLASIEDGSLRDYMESCRDIFVTFMDDAPAVIEYERARADRLVVIEGLRRKFPENTALTELENDYIAGRLSDSEFTSATYRLILASFNAQGSA